MKRSPAAISGRSRLVDYSSFEEVAVLRTMYGYPAGRRLTIAETAEVVRRMTQRRQTAREISDCLQIHIRSVRRIRARLRRRE
jgi:hypothetical protein